jgi:hypothetical protein
LCRRYLSKGNERYQGKFHSGLSSGK